MLSQLYIENIAVISKASINLRGGLNVFTGETGAGKTILINAINAVLGGRTYKDIIRSGESKALVSAVFTELPQRANDKLLELGYEAEGDLMLSRELFVDGKSGARINGRPATISVLREVAQLLIDIHGQNDNRELMDSERHLDFIDSFGETEPLHALYADSYRKLSAVRDKLRSTKLDDSYKLQRQDILQYQIDEIAAAELTHGEEEELRTQRNMIRNAEKITESLGAIYTLLNGSDEVNGILEGMSSLDGELATATKYIENLAEFGGKITEMQYDLEELSSGVRNLLEDSSFDPRQLDSIESRLDLIVRLQKKYGGSIAEVLSYYDKIIEEMDSLIFSDKELERLQAEEQGLLAETLLLADKLTTARLAAGKRFVGLVEQELTYLDMPDVRLRVVATKQEPSGRGQDAMEFYISANLGEEPRPIGKIASGGELSRIMLAIKNVLADKDGIGTIIFDEVDAGVSGRAAYKIGKKLHEVSACRQILCVTHLAQVAAFGDHHLRIYKTVEQERTYTHIDELDRESRIAELARITSGENLSEATLRSAEEMLAQTGH